MENKLTIEKVIDCIGFPKDTYDHATLKTYCNSIYELDIKRGESEEDAAMTIHPNAYIIVIPRNDSSMNAINIRINLPNIEKIDEFLQ